MKLSLINKWYITLWLKLKLSFNTLILVIILIFQSNILRPNQKLSFNKSITHGIETNVEAQILNS